MDGHKTAGTVSNSFCMVLLKSAYPHNLKQLPRNLLLRRLVVITTGNWNGNKWLNPDASYQQLMVPIGTFTAQNDVYGLALDYRRRHHLVFYKMDHHKASLQSIRTVRQMLTYALC
jgi:hypothetical protein